MSFISRIKNKICSCKIIVTMLIPIGLDFTSLLRADRFAIVTDVTQIAAFYKKAERNDLTAKHIKEFMEKGYDFAALIQDGEMISCACICHGMLNFSSPSFQALQERKGQAVILRDDVSYLGYCFTDSSYRGKGYFTILLSSIIEHLAKSGKKKLILITGTHNTAMISCAERCGGKIIGFVKLSTVCGMPIKNVLYKNPSLTYLA